MQLQGSSFARCDRVQQAASPSRHYSPLGLPPLRHARGIGPRSHRGIMAVGAGQTLLRTAAVATMAVAAAGLGASPLLAQARTASTQPPKGVPVPHEVTSRMLPLQSAR